MHYVKVERSNDLNDEIKGYQIKRSKVALALVVMLSFGRTAKYKKNMLDLDL